MGAAVIDHLVYATPDLDAAVEDLAERFGVRASPGGRHVGRGTRNALLGLGGRTYLEIIGPDPDQDMPAGTPLPFRIDLLGAPALVWYAVATDRLAGLVEELRAAGFDPGDPIDMQRARPDGVLLRWRLATHPDVPEGGVIPFLIDWLDSPHPSVDVPQGCRLVELRATHPTPDRLRPYLARTGDPVALDAGPQPGLMARLDTPKGPITLR
ncbi:MAG: VOC family protein [Acidimicrobiales bacterium]|nr:VOC family protein [Acidimicrobiales bacterium]